MRTEGINLHMESKKKLLVIVSFLGLACILSFVILLASKTMLSTLDSLLKSNYLYSLEMQSSTGTDEYIKYNGGIAFSLTSEAITGLNAEVVMQPEKTIYTDLVSWSPGRLKNNEIAISENLAKTYHLKVGDKLYSKHAVNSNISEYTIKQIFPALNSVRASKESFTDGIIVLGYDALYFENITHKNIIFTNMPLDELQNKYSEIPDNILYRDDEIMTVILHLAPWVIMYAALGVILTVGFVVFIDRGVASNYRRMVVLGFEKKELDRAYNNYTIGAGSLVLLGITLLSFAFICFTGLFSVLLMLLFIIMLLEFVSLIISSLMLRKRFWRS